MKWGVIVFPGSNCDRDCAHVLADALGQDVRLIWHGETFLGNLDAVILPGGFSYGDYLRTGAIAQLSPIMHAVKDFARTGGLVLGICNGFQILCETGLLEGTLVRNKGLRFVCRTVDLVAATADSPFTGECKVGKPLRIPIAHGEGCYIADDSTLDRMEAEDRVAFRYARSNPNGSFRDIAGVLNEGRNVLGMMPHPERACDVAVGSTDGMAVFHSMINAAGGASSGHSG